MDPLERAVACLGPAKLVLTRSGSEPDTDLAWLLNGKDGMQLRDDLLLQAAMYYKIVRTEAGQWKVSTRSYQYDLMRGSEPIFSLHWHPVGVSRYRDPHLHFWPHGSDASTMREHLPTRRMTFEDAVEWTIAIGAQPRGDWQNILETGRNTHIENSSWR